MNDPPVDTPLWGVRPPGLTLEREEIHAFAFSLQVVPSKLRQFEQLLGTDELDRADRFRRPRDRRRFVVNRAQLRMILGRYLGQDPALLEFRVGTHGKPSLAGGVHHELLRFNSSRSHDLGVLAVQLDEDLGIDVEHVRPFPEALNVAERFFSPAECEALHSSSPGEIDTTFFRYWTRKEAIVKSLGLGLSQPMDGFTLAEKPDGMAERVAVSISSGTVVQWALPLPVPSRDYVVALATAGSARPVHCWVWDGP